MIFGNHITYMFKSRSGDFFKNPFPKELDNDFLKLKEIAKRGMEEGKLIFDRTIEDDCGDLANCGLFYQQRNYYCFLHFTIQEFLAASKVVDDMDNVGTFLATHIGNPKWHLVIQFVFGFIGEKIKEARLGKIRDNQGVMNNWQGILDEVQKR